MKRSKSIYRRQSVLQGFAWQSMEEHLPDNLVSEYRQAFRSLDREHVGKITLEDLAMVVFSIGIRLPQIELLEFVNRVVDVKNLNFSESCLGFTEFLAVIAFIITDCVTIEEATRIFQEFDKDRDGYISADELRDLLLGLGDDVTDEEVQDMMREADMNGDGMVSLEEFIFVMNSAQSSEAACEQHICLPRILVDKKEKPLAGISPQYSGLLRRCSLDHCSLELVPEETKQCENKLHCVRRDSIINEQSSIICKNVSKKKHNFTSWMKQVEKNENCKQLTNCISDSNEKISSSSSSSLKKRRKSSITRTLRHGRDALIATAKTLRRISR